MNNQAVVYWLKAGQLALKRSANLEAASHLRKGLELVGSLPGSEERLRLELSLESATGHGNDCSQGLGCSGGPSSLFESADARRHAERQDLRYSPRCEARARIRPFQATCARPRCWATNANRSDWSSRKRPIIQVTSSKRIISSGGSTFISVTTTPANFMRAMAWPPMITSGIVTLPGAMPDTTPVYAAGRFPHRCSSCAASPDQAVARSREAIALAERDLHPLSTGAGAD